MKKLLLSFLAAASFTMSVAQQLNVNLLHHWDNQFIQGSAAYDNAYNEVWGYAAGGKEYAIIGSTRGTHIHDVTDPSSAYEAVFIQGADTGAGIIHRDYKTYGNYLYAVCDEGSSTLQIIDLSQLPASAPVVYSSSVLFSRSHNIFIDTATAKLYVCGGPFNLRVYSLANPVSPTLLVNCNSTTIPFWSQISHVHDLYVQNDTAYLHAGPDGMHIVNFANTGSPQLLASLTFYPQKGYNHSGWLDNSTRSYYFADENHGYAIKAYDFSDFSNLALTDTFSSGITYNSIPHNLFVKGGYLYVSYYYDGLRIFDISDPQNIWQAGAYDTYPQENFSSYKGAWGVYPYFPSGNILVSDMQTGLYVFSALPVSVNENKGNELFRFYPNPAGSQVVFTSATESPLTIHLTDLRGRELKTMEVTGKHVLELSGFPAGIYLISTPGQPGRTQKLVVAKP